MDVAVADGRQRRATGCALLALLILAAARAPRDACVAVAKARRAGRRGRRLAAALRACREETRPSAASSGNGGGGGGDGGGGAATAAARTLSQRRLQSPTASEPSGPVSAPLSRAGPSRGPVHAWRLADTLRLQTHDFGRALWWGDSSRHGERTVTYMR
jgi:hypothetical protein